MRFGSYEKILLNAEQYSHFFITLYDSRISLLMKSFVNAFMK